MIPTHVLAWLEEARRQGTKTRFAPDQPVDYCYEDFVKLALVEWDGPKLLMALQEGACQEAESLNLCHAYRGKDGKVHFSVPDWQKLILFLRTVKG